MYVLVIVMYNDIRVVKINIKIFFENVNGFSSLKLICYFVYDKYDDIKLIVRRV